MPDPQETLDRTRKFCREQRDSHRRLREQDSSYSEYHRGAQWAYEAVLRHTRPPAPAQPVKDAFDQLDQIIAEGPPSTGIQSDPTPTEDIVADAACRELLRRVKLGGVVFDRISNADLVEIVARFGR